MSARASISTWDAVRVQQKAAQHDGRDLAGERARDAAQVERIYAQMPPMVHQPPFRDNEVYEAPEDAGAYGVLAAYTPDTATEARAERADAEAWWASVLASGPECADEESE